MVRLKQVEQEFNAFVMDLATERKHYGAVLAIARDRHGRIRGYNMSENILTLNYQALSLTPFLLTGVTSSTVNMANAGSSSSPVAYLELLVGTGTTTPTMADTGLSTPYGVMSIVQGNFYSWTAGNTSRVSVASIASGYLLNGTTLQWTPPSGSATTYTLAQVAINVSMSGIFPSAVNISEIGLMLSDTAYSKATTISVNPTGLLLEHDLLSPAVSVPAGGTLALQIVLGV